VEEMPQMQMKNFVLFSGAQSYSSTVSRELCPDVMMKISMKLPESEQRASNVSI